MKKKIAWFLAVVLAIGSLAGCGGGQNSTESETEETQGADVTDAAAGETTNTSEETGDTAEEMTDAAEKTADGAEGWPAYEDTIYIGVSIRSLTNPYHVNVSEGAKLLASDLTEAGYNVEVTVMECNGSDDQQINDIKGLIAKGGQNTVLYVDPNNSSLARSIADICEEAGVYWGATWNKEEEDNIMDYPHWVTFTSPDDVATGYDTGTALCEVLGGEGKIAVEGGLEANTSSINRIKGLEKALEEYPNIEVVDTQYCDWDMTKALETTETWLSKYPDLDGIWCADDTMALGTVQALQNAGKNGEIYVTGDAGTVDAMDAIEAGDMFATWDVGGYNQGYYTTAYGVAALLGVIDTESMSLEERQFLTAGQLVTADNLEEMRNQNPDFDYLDLAAYNVGPME